MANIGYNICDNYDADLTGTGASDRIAESSLKKDSVTNRKLVRILGGIAQCVFWQ
jgi:hypothetical protein